MNILLVEDNKTIANNIKKYLELDWNKITLAENWLYALEVFKHNIFDIVILDIMLPWMDGIQLCKKFKKINNEIAIIMTTAKWQLEDKLEWFNCWTDDYLVKPFDLEELDARIKAIIKRSPQKDFIEYKDIRLDKDQKKIFKKNKEIKFTIKEFMIIELLLENKWRSISRTNIIEDIRGNENIFEEDWKLDVYISNIRRKLWKNLIETIKWYGYQVW